MKKSVSDTPTFKHTWETFLRVGDPITSDLAPDADPLFLVSKGIEPAAPTVLRHLREDVLPLVRRLERRNQLEWYSFLIHGYGSGVPVLPEDKNLYVHLRLSFKRFVPLGAVMVGPWQMGQKFTVSDKIAGINERVLVGGVNAAWHFIGKQSAMILDLIEMHSKDVDNFALLKHVRQFLHYWSNMMQMRVA